MVEDPIRSIHCFLWNLYLCLFVDFFASGLINTYFNLLKSCLFYRGLDRNQYPTPLSPSKLVRLVCFISRTSVAFKASGQRLPFWDTSKGIVWIFRMIFGLVVAARYGNGIALLRCITINLFPFIGPQGNPYNSRILDTATTQVRMREHHYHYHPPPSLTKCPEFRLLWS